MGTRFWFHVSGSVFHRVALTPSSPTLAWMHPCNYSILRTTLHLENLYVFSRKALRTSNSVAHAYYQELNWRTCIWVPLVPGLDSESSNGTSDVTVPICKWFQEERRLMLLACFLSVCRKYSHNGHEDTFSPSPRKTQCNWVHNGNLARKGTNGQLPR